jgi:CTP:molybdopterin cytidylyltransferase MocA
VIAGVALAAGEGRRFGGAKQLHPVDGRPMLEHVLHALARSPIQRRLVVLGAHAQRVLAEVDLYGAEPVVNDRWRDGQAASLRAAVDALGDGAEALVVVLGDGPALAPAAVERVLETWSARGGPELVSADYGGGRSHPVLIPRAAFARLPSRGERPGRGLPAVRVDCRDLPEPGDWDYR